MTSGRPAERYGADISAQVEAGEGVLRRLSQIVSATRSLAAPAVPAPAAQASPAPAGPAPEARDLVAAANAIAERTRSRLSGLAA